MTKVMTAADRDQLVTDAINAGLDASRSYRDFFVELNGERQRVTPTQLREMIALAQEMQAEEADKAAYFAEQEAQVSEEVAAEVVEVAEPAQPEVEPAAEVTNPQHEAAAPAKRVVKYGPPCGGEVAHLEVVTSEAARNPLMHLPFKPSTTYRNKEEAAAAGKRSCERGFLAFMAHHAGQTFWVVACANERGSLTLDGQELVLKLAEGEQAEACRLEVPNKRWQSKTHWVAEAV